MGTPEEAVIAYIRGDVEYDVAEAHIAAINPSQAKVLIARICEVIKLLNSRRRLRPARAKARG